MSDLANEADEGYDHRVDLTALQETINYVFSDIALLERAVIHRSYTNEHPSVTVNNQRLEYLGDSVLGLLIAEELFRRFPEAEEGPLSSLASQIVCESSLLEIAQRIELGHYLRLGRGEALTGGREKPGNLSDAYEALLAAVYLDGGLDAARRVVLTLQGEALDASEVSPIPADHKSRLQRIVQNATTPPPKYVIIEESGPPHEKTFVSEVRINEEPIARGQGRSKKEAEQHAAACALETFEDAERH